MATSTIDILVRATDAASRVIAGVANSADGIGSSMSRAGVVMQGVGRTLTRNVSIPLALVGGLAVKAAVDWESAWAGVTKTVDGTKQELAGLEEGIRQMAASEVPATAEEIAAVAEAAGALGVATPNILAFTRTMIDMGESTNLSADMAAEQMARFANIMSTPQTAFDRIGSAIVDLGNNGASTEAEISAMSLNIAAAGRQVNLTEAQVLGFGNALASLGIEAEKGGTAISRAFFEMQAAVRGGGKELAVFSDVAGMSSQQFAQAFEKDAGAAMVAFMTGLGKMTDEGKDVTGTLEKLGLSEIRVRDTMLRTAGAAEMVGRSLDISSAAWEKNSALTDEATKRYATSESQMRMMVNRLREAGIELGQKLVPIITEDVIPAVDGLIDRWDGLSDSTQNMVLKFGAVAIALGPVLNGLGGLLRIGGAAASGISNLAGWFVKIGQAASESLSTGLRAGSGAAGALGTSLAGLAAGGAGVTAAAAAGIGLVAAAAVYAGKRLLDMRSAAERLKIESLQGRDVSEDLLAAHTEALGLHDPTDNWFTSAIKNGGLLGAVFGAIDQGMDQLNADALVDANAEAKSLVDNLLAAKDAVRQAFVRDELLMRINVEDPSKGGLNQQLAEGVISAEEYFDALEAIRLQYNLTDGAAGKWIDSLLAQETAYGRFSDELLTAQGTDKEIAGLEGMTSALKRSGIQLDANTTKAIEADIANNDLAFASMRLSSAIGDSLNKALRQHGEELSRVQRKQIETAMRSGNLQRAMNLYGDAMRENNAGIRKVNAGLNKYGHALDKSTVSQIRAALEAGRVERAMKLLDQAIRKLPKKTKAEIDANVKGKPEIDRLQRDLKIIDGQKSGVEVDVTQVKGAGTEVDRTKGKVQDLDREKATPRVSAPGAVSAAANVQNVLDNINALDGEEAHVDVFYHRHTDGPAPPEGAPREPTGAGEDAGDGAGGGKVAGRQSAAAPTSPLLGIRIVGTLDTPWGPAKMDARILELIRSESEFAGSVARQRRN